MQQYPPRISLRGIFLAFLGIGLTAYGMAILQKLRVLVIRRGWLTEEKTNEGLAMVQLYPGPIMVDFTAYVGYRLRGVPGALLATLGFVLPAFVLVLLLSAAYFAGGDLPWVHQLFLGLEALLIGVIADITLKLGQQALKGPVEVLIALAAFVALLVGVNAILVPLVALILGAFAIVPAQGAALATFAIFAPSIAMTLLFTELFDRIRHLQRVRGALAGVLAAFVGLLAATLVQLGGAVLDGPLMLTFAAAAFVATRWFKLDMIWVLGAGLALWTLLLATGWAR